jgi:hypothetical protein
LAIREGGRGSVEEGRIGEEDDGVDKNGKSWHPKMG